MIAQQLYEGIELPGEGAVGLITYMRTDSTRVSEEAITDVREHVGKKFGPDYVPDKANFYKTKKDAQDAHEAIRPTSMQWDPEIGARAPHGGPVLPLSPDLEPLCRVADAPGDLRRHDGGHRGSELSVPRQRLRAEIRRLDGGLRARRGRGAHRPFDRLRSPRAESRGEGAGPDAVSAEDEEGSGVLPPLAEGDRLDLKELKPEQKFTQPPPRYSESTLVKAMEENGIGRPSTYASIITVIQAREYVNKIEGRFKPTVLGRMLVDRLLSPAFDDILEVNYTRELEEDLDKIEEGTENYESTLTSFYKKFKKDLETRQEVDAQLQGRGAAGSRRRLRQVRQADGDEGRQVRPLPRLQRLSRLREHARARNARSRSRRRRRH